MNRMTMMAAALAAASPLAQVPAGVSPAAKSSATLDARVTAARQRLVAAILANDADGRARLYRPDAISMPEYQPALFGPGEIASYHRTLQGRMLVTDYLPQVREILDFGDAVLEFGTFTITWSSAAGAPESRRGKYAHLWGVEPDGSLRLKADVWGYFEALPDPARFHVALPEASAARGPRGGDAGIARTLARLNAADAAAVRTRDVEAKLALLADDAVIMPFADTPKSGMAEIRPYLTQYTANGAGITFDDVRVWNIGFEVFGDYVVEYPKFHVDWRFPGQKGVTKGGGLHLWKRQPDGGLKRFRQIGTHDHVP